jgi:hypothetical protein
LIEFFISQYAQELFRRPTNLNGVTHRARA